MDDAIRPPARRATVELSDSECCSFINKHSYHPRYTDKYEYTITGVQAGCGSFSYQNFVEWKDIEIFYKTVWNSGHLKCITQFSSVLSLCTSNEGSSGFNIRVYITRVVYILPDSFISSLLCKRDVFDHAQRSTLSNVSKPRTTYWEKTTSLAVTGLPYGPQAHTTASTVLAGTRIQERARSTTGELEEYSQQRPTKDRVHLGGSRGGSSWQTRMASECGPMCPVGCGINQGQGQDSRSCHTWLAVYCLLLFKS